MVKVLYMLTVCVVTSHILHYQCAAPTWALHGSRVKARRPATKACHRGEGRGANGEQDTGAELGAVVVQQAG